MRIKINQAKLKEGINVAERISSRSTSLPVLKNILLRVTGNYLNVSSTDLETGIQWWSLVKKEKEGSVLIPASILSGFVNFLPGKTVNLSVVKNDLNIECDDYKTQIKGLDPEEFPIIPTVSEKNSAVISSDVLCKGLAQISDIPALSTTRPEISGVYLSFEKDKVKMVATDSYRLGEKVVGLNGSVKEKFSLILPQKAAKEIINIFSEREGDIKIILGANQVLFESLMEETSHPQIQFISRIVEGEYPKYEEIIPEKSSIQAVLNKGDFLNQIKAASLFSGKVSEIIFKINPEKKGIEILSQSPDSGEFKSFISGKIKGKKAEVSFNYKFLTEGISSIKSQDIVFETNSGSEPGVFKPVGSSDFIYIVMPIKSS